MDPPALSQDGSLFDTRRKKGKRKKSPKKGGDMAEYQQLSTAVADDEEDPCCSIHEANMEQQQEPSSRCKTVWNQNWISSDASDWTYRNEVLILPVKGVKFLKFLLITFVEIIIMHYLVRLVNWEHDSNYTISDMILYDGNLILLDLLVFYVIGNLYQRNGVDHLGWVVPTLTSALCTSWSTNLSFMQHSFSLYDMHCHWPWTLWVFCAIMIPLVAWVVWLHIRFAYAQRVLVTKILQLILTVLLFLVPYASHPNFHLHHWYLGWLLGMHANLEQWQSRITMAWLWGWYVNGIAVYGRDAILTCADAFYRSTDQHCPYMACYVEPTHNDTSSTPKYKPMEEPNWRNCSGYIP